MMQRHDRFDPIFLAAPDHLAVMLDLLLVKPALFRLDPRPLNRETICVQSGFRHQPDIFFIPIVMIDRIQRRFHICRMLHLFHCPAVTVCVVSLYLMRRRCRSQKKTFFKFFHNRPPRLHLFCLYHTRNENFMRSFFRLCVSVFAMFHF